MASEPEDQRLQLFRDVAEAERKRKATRPPTPAVRPSAPSFETVPSARGSAAGFYVLLAICALLVMVVGGVYLTRRQSQQPRNDFASFKTTLPPPLGTPLQTLAPPHPMPAVPPAASTVSTNAANQSPLNTAALPAAPAAASTQSNGNSGNSGNTGLGAAPLIIPPPIPIVGPNVFPAATATQPAAAPPATSGDNFSNNSFGNGGGITPTQNNAPAPSSDSVAPTQGTATQSANTPTANPGASQSLNTVGGLSGASVGQ